MAGYIGSKAVNLSTTGADINGDANIDGDLSFRDNDKAIFGAGSDLQIYHDGSNSYITEGGVGDLRLGAANIRIGDNTSGAKYIYATQNAEVTLYHNNSAKLATSSTGVDITGTITSDGLTVDTNTLHVDATNNRVGIGTSSPSALIHASGAAASGGAVEIRLEDTAASSNSRLMRTGSAYSYAGVGANETWLYHAGAGTINIGPDGAGAVKIVNNGSEAMRIDSSGNVGIGTTSPHLYYSSQLVVDAPDESGITIVGDTTHQNYIMFADGTSGDARYRGYIGYDHALDNIKFATSAAEAMRINSSGHVLIGKTADDNTTAGIALHDNGFMSIARSSNIAMILDRHDSDGDILRFTKGGSTAGDIGTDNGGDLYLGNSATGLLFAGGSQAILPWDPSGPTSQDDYVSLGLSSHRFDDIYATNSSIQTSDRNEKQDIAELTDAEQRVAVAAKGLMRKFRWKSAVAEKGDNARTHFGIIAQDLQAAFAAEGLDAGDYAMFISSTWTDEETGEERTRMGVRYSELLAFIIGAL